MIPGLKNNPKINALTAIGPKLYFFIRAYGRKRAALVGLVILFQGLSQVAGVASIFPFLALAANPQAFRDTKLGMGMGNHAPALSDSALLLIAGSMSIAALLFTNIFSLFGDWVRSTYSHGLGHWLREKLLLKLASQPWSFYLNANSGVLLKKTAQDVMKMIFGVLFPAMEAISRLVTVVMLVVLLFFVSPKVAMSALLVTSIYYLIVYALLRSRHAAASEALKEADRGAMVEGQQFLAGIKTVKIFLAEKYFISRYVKHSLAQAQVNVRLPIYSNGPKYLLESLAFGGIIIFVMASKSAGKDLAGILPVLGVIGFAGYRLLPAAQILYAQVAQLVTQRHSLDEVFDEFSRDVDVVKYPSIREESFTRPQPTTWRHEVRFDSISFSYGPSSAPIFHDLSLAIHKNASIGVVGPTGSGKSTFVDLVLGLHRPTAGEIRIDGEPLRDSQIRAWQAGIGYVPQDVFLIDDTLARNIAFGVDDADIDWDRLREVAKAAQILDFIEKGMPNGFHSSVGERGVRLSGGQRQRIAIARALYRRPQLLLLDEATSALDTKTEEEVTNAIRALHGSITMVVVAHRLSTIDHCDQIINLATFNHAHSHGR